VVILAVLTIPVLAIVILLQAITRKPIVKTAVALGCCVVSIIPLSIVGALSSDITYSRSEREYEVESGAEIEAYEIASEVGIEMGHIVEEVSDTEVLDGCERGEHIMGKSFSFQSHNSTAMSHIEPFCENCNHYFGYTLFRGTPNDVSYLDVIKEHSDGSEIIGGEYYTITATVTLGDYEIDKTKLRCKVAGESIIAVFSVEFREEFEEQVDLIVEGDEIVFRGRLYDEGFGFTDCKLINN
jgi:hypothetical protein